MDKQEKLKAKVLAETLRLMATKIENGFPLTDEHITMLKSLSKDIVWLHPREYDKPVSNGLKMDEPETFDRKPYRRTTLPDADVKIKEQKMKKFTKRKNKENIGKEPGE